MKDLHSVNVYVANFLAVTKNSDPRISEYSEFLSYIPYALD